MGTAYGVRGKSDRVSNPPYSSASGLTASMGETGLCSSAARCGQSNRHVSSEQRATAPFNVGRDSVCSRVSAATRPALPDRCESRRHHPSNLPSDSVGVDGDTSHRNLCPQHTQHQRRAMSQQLNSIRIGWFVQLKKRKSVRHPLTPPQTRCR